MDTLMDRQCLPLWRVVASLPSDHYACGSTRLVGNGQSNGGFCGFNGCGYSLYSTTLA